MRTMKKRGDSLKIYLFRHGKTTYNRDHRFTGFRDAKLTKEGIAHAKKIAKELRDKKFEVAIHTRLSRSKDTLKYVLKFHPECKTVIQDDRMIERSYGDLAGMKHDDFIRNVGERLYDLKFEGDFMCDLKPEKRKEIEKFLGEKEYEVIHRGWDTPAQNGESFKDVEARVNEFIRDLKKFMKKENVNVAISAHGNSIRLFRKIMEKASIKETVGWFIPYDKVFVYKI